MRPQDPSPGSAAPGSRPRRPLSASVFMLPHALCVFVIQSPFLFSREDPQERAASPQGDLSADLQHDQLPLRRPFFRVRSHSQSWESGRGPVSLGSQGAPPEAPLTGPPLRPEGPRLAANVPTQPVPRAAPSSVGIRLHPSVGSCMTAQDPAPFLAGPRGCCVVQERDRPRGPWESVFGKLQLAPGEAAWEPRPRPPPPPGCRRSAPLLCDGPICVRRGL